MFRAADISGCRVGAGVDGVGQRSLGGERSEGRAPESPVSPSDPVLVGPGVVCCVMDVVLSSGFTDTATL